MNLIRIESAKQNTRATYKLGGCLAGLALLLSGCAASSTPSNSATYQTPPAVPELSPVNTPESKAATYLINSLSRGGSAATMKTVSPTVRFHTNGVMFALDRCRLTTGWYSTDTGSVLSGEATCPDGDIVALDVTFDANGKVTKVFGQGAHRTFDSTLSTNRVF